MEIENKNFDTLLSCKKAKDLLENRVHRFVDLEIKWLEDMLNLIYEKETDSMFFIDIQKIIEELNIIPERKNLLEQFIKYCKKQMYDEQVRKN
jgi:hypothetical protein